MTIKGKTYHKRGQPIDGHWPVTTHPLYKTWAGMISRCENPNSKNYHGRGIAVCKRWRESFEAFLSDMGKKPSPFHSVERKRNSGNYTPSNCVWGTRSEQAFNRNKFKNNATGATGVVQIKDRFESRFDYENKRYIIGRYDSLVDAKRERRTFIELFMRDRVAAVTSIASPTLWCTSSTRIRGVVPHSDGKGFVVRVTINKIRHYVGYFTDINAAQNARDHYISERS